MTNRTRLRGFASLSKERRREIASMGGIAAHVQGTAHQFTSQEASLAGIKGAQARSHRKATTKRH